MTQPNNLIPQLPYTFAKSKGSVFIIDKNSACQILACTSTIESNTLMEIRRFTNQPFQWKIVSDDEFDHFLHIEFEQKSNRTVQAMEAIDEQQDLFQLAAELPETQDLLAENDEAPIIKLINALLTEAVKENASDIHVEPYENRLVVRFRIDGVLRTILEPQPALAPRLASRIKIMAKLDIAEKRIPQDGRISLKIATRAVDVRVSTIPSSYGERVVMRILDKQAGNLNLQHLGLSDASYQELNQLIKRPHGIILVTGPTGSGKTTTLYAALSQLNNDKRNILTVEDPIEYELDGIGQTQVNLKVDMTFAKGLRAILRQDPDIVMVGEIRDLETAQIAVQASLTGHLVFSTLHTNTASGAITRLRDMGIEPFLLSSSIIGVIAQRLVRLLCPHCKIAHQPTVEECDILGIQATDHATIHSASSCKHCNHTGFKGRTGIYELLNFDENLRHLIHQASAEKDVENYARKISQSIRSDGVRRVLQGDTTIDELIRVSQED
ncbi:MAG: type II secretion system ATPase GspE [Methylococcales bacterium]|jgi:general secretion pathway protein E|nr:type II secretion system ATPase GspE [Methylococcales bacterium]MBT7411342.1 type II secretion system ATPase GspE [Methylococcales bacterium]